jgi:serine/threonine protein kinase
MSSQVHRDMKPGNILLNSLGEARAHIRKLRAGGHAARTAVAAAFTPVPRPAQVI